jgi:5-methylcytosine-specific restriction endonuclease McrA
MGHCDKKILKNMCKKGHKQTEEHKRKIKESNLGQKRTSETKQRMKEKKRIFFANGGHAHNKGIKGVYHHTDEIKEKIRKSSKERIASEETRKKIGDAHRGEKCNFYKDGKSKEPYTPDWTYSLKRSIRLRDKFTCQICNKRGWIVHHIDYNKKNCKPENLVIVCKSCHSKTNFNREKWIRFFSDPNS